MLEKQQKRYRRHRRVKAKILGTARRPRLCAFRSARHIYVQLIDDEKGKTLLATSDLEIKKIKNTKKEKNKKNEKVLVGKTAKAREVGKLIAKKALEKKIEKVVFDRGGYKYHGRVRAVAEGAREGGLKF
jgi:large subunit ribosomal protein L18